MLSVELVGYAKLLRHTKSWKNVHFSPSAIFGQLSDLSFTVVLRKFIISLKYFILCFI